MIKLTILTNFDQDDLSQIEKIIKFNTKFNNTNDFVSYLFNRLINNHFTIENPAAKNYNKRFTIMDKRSGIKKLNSVPEREISFVLDNKLSCFVLNKYPEIIENLGETLAQESFWTFDRLINYCFTQILVGHEAKIILPLTKHDQTLIGQTHSDYQLAILKNAVKHN